MPVVQTQPPALIRTSTSFSLLDRIRSHKDVRAERPPSSNRRSGSFGAVYEQNPQPTLFSMHATEGAGSRARRMSANTPDDFVVKTCELDTEFVSPSKLRIPKNVGKGTSATVRVMIRKCDRYIDKCPQFAVKEFRKRSVKESEEDYIKKVKSEYTIAKSLHHPNIVETVQLCTNHGRWDHVMEYCQLGELYHLVERKYFKPEDKLCIFKQVLKGIGYLHDHGIAHRDIKLENLLMTDQGYIKITDFGVSEVFCGDHPGIRSANGECGRNMGECRKSAPGICGSRPYISPEVLEANTEYDPTKLDVWACAILYLTLYHAGTPWQSASRYEINYNTFAEGWEAFLQRSSDIPIDEYTYPQCGQIFQTLPSNGQRRCILKMLHPIPEKRCTINDALSDRWVKKIESCSPDDTTPDYLAPSSIDVSAPDSCRLMAKMKIQAKHDHLPPPVKRLPQHSFDMGNGY